MKIIQSEEGYFIKVDDVVNYINEHKQLIQNTNAINDPELLRWYLLAHDHLKTSIEHEIRFQKMEGKIYAGDHNNSDNLCNVSNDLMDKQEEVRYPTIKVLVQIDGETHYECNLQESNKEK